MSQISHKKIILAALLLIATILVIGIYINLQSSESGAKSKSKSKSKSKEKEKKELDRDNPVNFLTKKYLTKVRKKLRTDPNLILHKDIKPIPLKEHRQFELIKTAVGVLGNRGALPLGLFDKNYVDVRGDGNCGYYSIIYLIYNDLRNTDSRIYKRLFSLERFEYANMENEAMREQIAVVQEILKRKERFDQLTALEP